MNARVVKGMAAVAMVTALGVGVTLGFAGSPFGGPTPPGGGGASCGEDEECAALGYVATRTDGEAGFVCTGTGVCIDLGPGSCNNWGTNAGGDIVAGEDGVCTPTVKVGNTSLGNGTVSISNGAFVGTNSYLQLGGGSLVTTLLLVPVTIDVGNITASTCLDVTATVAGVEANDGVFVTRNFASTANYSVSDAYVTNAGTDEVTFRACTPSILDVNPASGSYLFWVVRKQ